MNPPPAIPDCPLCRQPMSYVIAFDVWVCANDLCNDQQEDVFSLADYTEREQSKARRLADLDTGSEADDDCPEDEW